MVLAALVLSVVLALLVLAALVLLEFESSDDLSEPLGDELPEDAATSTLVLLNSISWKSVWRQLVSSVLQNLHDTSSDFPEHCSCHRAIHRAGGVLQRKKQPGAVRQAGTGGHLSTSFRRAAGTRPRAPVPPARREGAQLSWELRGVALRVRPRAVD